MVKLYYEKIAVIRHQGGLHTRVGAMVVQKYHELTTQYQATILFKYHHREKILANNLMLLCSLKIKSGEELLVMSTGNQAELAVQQMVDFLESDFKLSNPRAITERQTLLSPDRSSPVN